MRPLLARAGQGPVTNKIGVETVTAAFSLSETQVAELLPSGSQTKVSNRVAWAFIYMARAGLLSRLRRGVYEITERGQQTLRAHPDRIDNKVLQEFPEFRDFTTGVSRASEEEGTDTDIAADTTLSATPLEQLENAYRTLSAALSVEIIDRILAGTPVFFEKLVVKLLTEMGYGGTIEEAAKHLGGPNDGGVDGVIQLDALGIDKVYIQAKRYARNVTVSRQDVQAFSGALDDKQTTRGVFITTSTFSSGAIAYVKSIPKQIVLIDGARLSDLLVRYGVGVRAERTVVIKKVDEDFFEEA
jgi:restriction system protein